MEPITTSAAVAAFCARIDGAEYVTVDTEFMREHTFWPRLCLVQIGGPDQAAAIDPLADGIDLDPLLDLMANERVLKVFHAARQDLEIFYQLSGRVPAPLFDTQVAAMVCGFGDSVSYEALAGKLAKARIDKSLRFTDWARRPLSKQQLGYALDDVRHLRVIYERLAERLERTGRAPWVAEEMAALADPGLYDMNPELAWRRIKTRATDPRQLAILREVAAWRERRAQTRDVPRNRILRDEALLEIAARAPVSTEALARTRGLGRKFAEGSAGHEVIAAVEHGLAVPEEDCPQVMKPKPIPRGVGPVVDLLKVLLKMRSEQHDVAQRLVASAADLERIAGENEPEVRALQGWRREIFGADALALKCGRLALVVCDRSVCLVPAPESKAAE
ncbi:MAG: ribonuclease D [Alphaproteobacteria bacterium]